MIVLFMDAKELIKENIIDEDLVIRTYGTKERLILEISYLDNRHMVIKNYPKNIKGEKECEEFESKFKSSDDIRNYLRLKGAKK